MRTTSTVEHLLTTRSGDVSGLVLGDGMIVDVPPGHGNTLRAMLKRGDEVKVEGEPRRSRRGRMHVLAQRIAMPAHRHSNETMDESEPDAQEEITGVVRRLIFNGNGYVSGFRLFDGTFVKTPLRQGEQILAHVHYGDEVRIEGYRRLSTKGSPLFVAQRIRILQHDSATESPAKTEFFPSSMPLLLNRAILLMRKEKATLREIQAIQSFLEKNRNESVV